MIESEYQCEPLIEETLRFMALCRDRVVMLPQTRHEDWGF